MGGEELFVPLSVFERSEKVVVRVKRRSTEQGEHQESTKKLRRGQGISFLFTSRTRSVRSVWGGSTASRARGRGFRLAGRRRWRTIGEARGAGRRERARVGRLVSEPDRTTGCCGERGNKQTTNPAGARWARRRPSEQGRGDSLASPAAASGGQLCPRVARTTVAVSSRRVEAELQQSDRDGGSKKKKASKVRTKAVEQGGVWARCGGRELVFKSAHSLGFWVSPTFGLSG